MTDQNYSSLKVAELKEILKERGIATSGTKAELVAKLQEHDKQNQQEEQPQQEQQEQQEQQQQQQQQPEENEKDKETEQQPQTTSDQAPAGGSEGVEADNTDDKSKDQEEPEEEEKDWLKLVTDELDKRIKRAERFSSGDVEELKKQKQRIEKFGVDKKQAQSILYGKTPRSNIKKHHNNRRGHHHSNRNKVHKDTAMDDPQKLDQRKKRFAA